MAVAFAHDTVFAQHHTGVHPEKAERLTAIIGHLASCGLLARLQPLGAEAATRADLRRVHTPAHIERVERMAESGGGHLDADTPVSAGSYRAALYAAGSTLAVARAVLSGEAAQAFALVRPPGHHATPDRAMGFCLFCNVAVAAAWAIEVAGLERVAIVDFDVHHGNGVVAAFRDEDRVLYVSTHEHPHYPYSGDWQYTGVGRSAGRCINIALPHAAGDQAWDLAIPLIIAPALRRFRPELILVSAGYDAHWADDISTLRMSVAGTYRFVSALVALATELCAGRMALTLEGGYERESLAHGVAATFAALLQRPYEDVVGPAPWPGAGADERLHEIARLHGLL